MKTKKKPRLKRHLSIFKRRARKAGRTDVGVWLIENVRQHPFITALFFFIWINAVLNGNIFSSSIQKILLFHLAIFGIWLILVLLTNPLKDKDKVKWYFKKRFVFFTLFILPPLGLILLWVGSGFKKITKIVFTVISCAIIVITSVYNNKEYDKLWSGSSIEGIIEKINRSKGKIYLKTLDISGPLNLRLSKIPPRAREKLSVAQIAKQYSEAVVSIKTRDRDGDELGMGSGFVISEDGYIATNFHVLESARQIEVKIGDDTYTDVLVVKVIKDMDLALLKINAKGLTALPIGDSDILQNGQPVVVLGNPWGFERSVSSGVISAMRSKDSMKLIQTTAPVSPGSSGGPIINEYGEAVGIATIAFFFMAQNLNFAIPINYLNKIINEG